MNDKPSIVPLLPSLHALVEKWRNLVADSAWHPYYRTTWTSCADELEALLSRAATTQAGEVDEYGLPDALLDKWRCELVAHGRWKNNSEIELCAASDPKARGLYLCDAPPSQPVAPVVADGCVLLPSEPTEALVHALCPEGPDCRKCPKSKADPKYKRVYPMCYGLAEESYKALLAAAPHPAQPQEREPRAG